MRLNFNVIGSVRMQLICFGSADRIVEQSATEALLLAGNCFILPRLEIEVEERDVHQGSIEILLIQ